MKATEIERLIEKYFEGETTVSEEKILKDYFQQAEIPAHLQQYQSQFVFFAKAKKIELPESFESNWEKSIENEAGKVIQMQTASQGKQFYLRWGIQIAASVLLFLSGLYVGKVFWQDKESPKIAQNTEIESLRAEIKKTRDRQDEMLVMLKENSASGRIKAVNYSYEMKENNTEVIDALINTLNKDENTNVRLAAANALFAFRETEKVRNALIEALRNQQDPILKIALVNMMIAMKEKRAVKMIEDFLQTEPLPDVAKEAIRKKLSNI